MTYCNGAIKATVIIRESGAIVEQIQIDRSLPISVSCAPSNPCGVSGIWAFNYTAERVPGVFQFSFEGRSLEAVFFRSYPSPGCWNGTAWGLYASCGGAERTVLDVFSCGSGQVSMSNLTFTPDEADGLEIRDSQGALVYQRSVSECDFSVGCGDECPEGYCKCKTLKYPGYCCCKCSKAH